MSLLFNTIFSSARQFKNHIDLFPTFKDESRDSQCKIWKKKTVKNLLNTKSFVYFRYDRLFKAKFSRRGTIHPDILADKHSALMVSLRRGWSKPIRMFKLCPSAENTRMDSTCPSYGEKLRPRSNFLTIRIDPKPDINIFIFSCVKLAYNIHLMCSPEGNRS